MSPSGSRNVIVCADADEMSAKAAEIFIATANVVLADESVFSVALSGGRTPEGLYRLLASDAYRSRVKWERVHFFWGDERAVGPRSPQSNFRMCKESLLKKLGLPLENIHRIKGEHGDRAAAEYEEDLAGFFKLKPGAFPRFGLVLIGMGADGHIASIFPSSAAVHEAEKIVLHVRVDAAMPERITLTPPALTHARNVVFLISGKDKAEALLNCLEGGLAPERLPAQLLRGAKGPVTWIVDKDAASMLNGM